MDAPLKRGDIVLVVASGDYGKPRPALIVQSDLFNETHASVTVCPITSALVQAPLFRVGVESSKASGLKKPSQVMADKILALNRAHIGKRIGVVAHEEMQGVEGALRLWLRL